MWVVILFSAKHPVSSYSVSCFFPQGLAGDSNLASTVSQRATRHVQTPWAFPRYLIKFKILQSDIAKRSAEKANEIAMWCYDDHFSSFGKERPSLLKVKELLYITGLWNQRKSLVLLKHICGNV